MALKLINLYVLDKIFQQAEKKLSIECRMLYITCLTEHFKNNNNDAAFELRKIDVPKYTYKVKYFNELNDAGLVGMSFEYIYFFNFWSEHIDKNILEKAKVVETFYELKTVGDYAKELSVSQSLKELCCMKLKLNFKQIEYLVELFVKEQVAIDKKYSNYSDCAKHFIYWASKNIDKAPKELVKSKSKLLGE